ncbi:MAG: hypothetical protein U0Q15_02160 [Kineosporiaceae bacterium]
MTEPWPPSREPHALDLPTRLVRRRRRSTLLMLAGCVGFVALGRWLLTWGEAGPAVVGVACIGVFGFFLAAGVVQLLAPPYVLLSPDGFRMRAFRTHAAPWSAVEDIRLMRAANRSFIQVVCPPLRGPGSRRPYRPMALPTYLEIPDPELVDLLIRYRETFGTTGTA